MGKVDRFQFMFINVFRQIFAWLCSRMCRDRDVFRPRSAAKGKEIKIQGLRVRSLSTTTGSVGASRHSQGRNGHSVTRDVFGPYQTMRSHMPKRVPADGFANCVAANTSTIEPGRIASGAAASPHCDFTDLMGTGPPSTVGYPGLSSKGAMPLADQDTAQHPRSVLQSFDGLSTGPSPHRIR